MRTFLYGVPTGQPIERFVVIAKNRKEADTTMAHISATSTYHNISIETFDKIVQDYRATSDNEMTVVLVSNGRVEKRIAVETAKT